VKSVLVKLSLTTAEFLDAQNADRAKRNAVGTYQKSGLSAYVVPEGVSPTNHTQFDGPNGPGFPYTWSPRYTIAHGWSAFPDKREDFKVNDHHERIPAVRNSTGYFYNPQDNPTGFAMTGNIGAAEGQGVHSLVSSVFRAGTRTDARSMSPSTLSGPDTSCSGVSWATLTLRSGWLKLLTWVRLPMLPLRTKSSAATRTHEQYCKYSIMHSSQVKRLRLPVIEVSVDVTDSDLACAV